MKKLAILLIICIFTTVTNAQEQIMVKSMDIYPSGTRVVFAIEASANMNFQIPAAFQIDSVKPIAVSGLKVNYFQKSSSYNSNNVPDVLKDLYQRIKDKEAELAQLTAQISSNQAKLGMITALTSGDISATNPTDYVKSLMQMHEESSTKINQLTYKHKDATNELARLNADYQKRLPSNYEQLIDINMGVTGKGTVLVEAFSNAASWGPSYKMNLNSKTKEITSTFVAQAQQRTGINYNGEINFYTQNPLRGMFYLPQPSPMIVDFVNDAPTISMKRSMNALMEESEVMYDATMAAPEPVLPQITESLTNFAVKGNGNIKGDGSVVSVELGETKYNANLNVLLFRDYSQEGHLVAKVDKIPEPFLAGQAEVSVDGQSSGQTTIANHGRGEDLAISFGLMPLIKVNKQSNVQKTGSGVFTGGTINDGYTLEVVNGSEITMDIELTDRVPYAINDKITVDNVVIEPKPNSNKEGVLTWTLSLKPGEIRKFKVDYRIKHPSDRKVYFR